MTELTTQQREAMQDRITDLQSQVDSAVIGYLSCCGWKHTSSTPDYVWRWEKEIDGRVLQVSRKTALSIEGVHDA
jgi:hypothetical protein